jgi:hypothetical protein
MGLFGQQAQQTSGKLAEQKASADGLRAAIQALNDVQRAGLGGMIGFEASIDAAGKAARDNAGSLNMVNGQLDLNSPKAQAAAAALNDLAAKTDEAAAASRESTGSWTGAIQVYERGRAQLIKSAQAMGLTKTEAAALADQILKIPDKTTRVKMDKEDAEAGLRSFNAAVKKTPGAKSVTLKTLSKGAETILESFGLKVKRLPDGSVKITTLNGQALKGVKDVEGALGRLPKSRKINITISHFTKRTVRNITEYQTKYLTGRSQHDIVGATGGLYTGTGFKHRGKGYAGGGMVDGPGTGTSDSVFAPWLSAREFVVNAKQTAEHLPLLRTINDGTLNARGPALADGGMAGMNVGRSITRSTRSSTSATPTVINQYMTLKMENTGVIGSQMELDNWLAKSLDNLHRTNRLPASLRRS